VTLSVGALVAYYLGVPTVSWVLVGMITVAATLKSVVGFCLGCEHAGRLGHRRRLHRGSRRSRHDALAVAWEG